MWEQPGLLFEIEQDLKDIWDSIPTIHQQELITVSSSLLIKSTSELNQQKLEVLNEHGIK